MILKNRRETDKASVAEMRTEAADEERPEIGTLRWGESGLWSAEEGMGKTVKGPSRLWRYKNGGVHNVVPVLGP